jgi:hypothetical protein
MDFDPEKNTLVFSNGREVEQFHSQLSALMRNVMFEASKDVEDAEQAKAISKEVFREFAVVTRVLNTLRQSLPRGRPPDRSGDAGDDDPE